ncbi:MAG: methionine synthase [Actinomycetota bacterium]|nr:methionine synthase [Actinomycetota bacterium]
MSDYLDLIKERVVIFDGATGTNLQLAQLGADDFGGAQFEGLNEHLVFTRPQVVADLHASFYEVGSDVVETNSFGSFPIVLAEYGIPEATFEINLEAARIARRVASEFSSPSRKRFVAGSMGPGTKLPSLGQIGFDELAAGYKEQVKGLLTGGVDLLLVETVYDLLGAKAAIIGAREAMSELGLWVPIQAQVTVELTGRMLPGTEIAAALVSLRAMDVDVIGMNCATGPNEMGEHLRYLTQNTSIPVSAQPNAGLPSVVEGRMHYDLTPEQLARAQHRFVEEMGVGVVGGCCGTTPEHISAVVEAVSGKRAQAHTFDAPPAVSSLYSAASITQDLSYFSVGERTNANGSKRFREAMLSQDWDVCLEIARDQVGEGADAIDLCVDYTGADGVADMESLASRLATASTLPIVLDSTEPQVIETGLKHLGGRPILNSVNLEDGDGPGTRLDSFLRLAKKYGAAVVATCIDQEGQARTAEWKLRAAKAIYEVATTRYGMKPGDLLFDPLVLPISTGMEESRRDGIETIEGIRRIKQEMPGVFTLVGLSNVSFGLSPAARAVLNSVFLAECTAAGLDAAIVHPSKILPLSKIGEEEKQVCLDLIYDRRREGYDPLSELIRLFEGVSAAGSTKEDLSLLPVTERLARRIIDGDRANISADLDEALAAGYSALDLINEHLLAGMKVVGDLFGSGQMQLPFVLSSAEAMKTAIAHLEPYMEAAAISKKGTVVLATVKGDVHDIGKNLVDIIFSNNGYEVHNLGIKVSISEMIAKALEVGADAIGMSGLLVKSTLIMRENLEEIASRGLERIPVLLGGAALTRTYVERDLRGNYPGRVFYGKDAFEGLGVMDKLMQIKAGALQDDTFGRELGTRKIGPRKSEQRALLPEPEVSRSPEVATDNPVFVPPFVGVRVASGIPIDEIATFLNETALFRNQWGYRPEKGENDGEFKQRVRVLLRQELDKAKAEGLLIPKVAWGYFAVGSRGNKLLVFADETRSEVVEEFDFPRQKSEPYLCISDFFRPADGSEVDYIAMQAVTMGPEVSRRTAELFTSNDYGAYLRLHGLGVEMAEALAEYWHHRIRTEWGFVAEDGESLAGLFRQKYRGGRYSFGYPACPRLEDNEKLVRLLGADRIGIEVSEGFQLHPEQSTTAIVCHHPQAKYFVA